MIIPTGVDRDWLAFHTVDATHELYGVPKVSTIRQYRGDASELGLVVFPGG